MCTEWMMDGEMLWRRESIVERGYKTYTRTFLVIQ